MAALCPPRPFLGASKLKVIEYYVGERINFLLIDEKPVRNLPRTIHLYSLKSIKNWPPKSNVTVALSLLNIFILIIFPSPDP